MSWSVFADPRDGARDIEIVRVSGESASRWHWPDVENLQSNQIHAPRRRRRFYLAVHGRRLPTGLIGPPNERQGLPERDGMRFCSLGTIRVGEVHEKTLRLRQERREIDDATDAWQTIRLHFGGRQFGVRRGLRVGEQRCASPRDQIER